MADTSTLKNDAKKAAFEAAYKAALLGKPMSQGAVNKVYDQQIKHDNKSTNITGGMPAGSYTRQNPTYNEVVDNRTTQQKLDDAQTAYDRYLASNEYKQKLDKVGRRLMRDDAKAKELNATVEHYRQQLQMEEDQRIMDADLKELESWSEEDRRNLEKFALEQNQHAINAMNPMLGPQLDTYALNPVVQKYGIAKVRQMAESWQRQQNAETMADVEEVAKNTANNRPVVGGVLGSAASVPANLVGGLTGVLGYVAEAGQRTGRYSTLDPNNIGNLPSVYGQTVRSEVTENIHGDEESTNWLRKLAALGYQGGMSALDSAARIVVSGGSSGISSALAASGAFSNGLRQYSQQGASPEQAAAMALTSAGLEYVTEKLPTDKVLDMFKKGGGKGVVRDILTQAFLVEPTSEEVNLFAGVAAEAMILGDKSGAKQQIGEMVANGMSYEEAKAQYYKSLWKEAAQTYAVSAISGGLSSAGATVLGNFVNGSQQTETQQQAAPAAPAVDETKIADQVFAQTGAEYAERMPESEVPAPLTEGQQNLNNAIAELLGVKQEESEPINEKQAEHISLEEQGTETEVKGTGAAEQNFSGNDQNAVGAAASQFKHEVKNSKVYENTYQNATDEETRSIGAEAKKAAPNIAKYDAVTEAESLHEAELRTRTEEERAAEFADLISKDSWSGSDNDTAMRLLKDFRKEEKTEEFLQLAKKQREMGTKAGQMIQSFAKYSREDAVVAVQDAIEDLDKLSIDQVSKRFWKDEQIASGKDGRQAAFENWKKEISKDMLGVANDIENVKNGDKKSMIDIVQQLANFRRTTAWAGNSSDLTQRTDRGISKMDFDTLKTVAKTQLSMIPSDFRKRNAGEIAKAIRVQNMLFTLTTKFKNDAGNITNGIMDAVSDSTSGRMVDAILGKITGMRTVGNDVRYAPEYIRAARNAADVAAAFVSLDIPMEADAKYSSGKTRTWSPNSGMVGRMMSAYEKHMKYALEVSDKFYEGGTTHTVRKSLERLGEKSGLTTEQINSLAEKTGERRTFKDPGYSVDKKGNARKGRALARTNVGLQKALNNIGTENIGLGDLLMPFAAVSGEVKQVGLDYTGGGLVSGIREISSIIKDVKNGMEIDPYRQRSAATNFGRGMTGIGLIAAFTAMAAAGAFKVNNDRDNEERIMGQTQGLSGAQWNLDSSLRWLDAIAKGSSIESANDAAGWNTGDTLVSVDFLEPYNSLMHIGYILSQDEDITIADASKAVLQGNFEALLEMPMMETLSDLADLQQSFTEVSDGDFGGVLDATGQLVGTVAGSAVPNWVRKTAQVVDPYYRDTYDTNPLKKAGKELVAAIPFASQMLPKKYDTLGKEQRRYDDGDLIDSTIDTMVTPWDTNTYETNEVYQEIKRLNSVDGMNVTPPRAKRVITYTDKNGERHENYNLTAEEYDTMQRAEGKTAARIIGDLTSNADYATLTDAQKAKVIGFAYDYAREQGRVDAIADYKGYSESWMKNIRGKEAKAIVNKVVGAELSNSMSAITNAWTNKYDTSEAIETLDAAYDVYKDLSMNARKAVKDDATGRMEAYLEARNNNIRTETFVDLYKTYWELDNSRKKASEKANEWAYTLERAQESGKLTEKQRDIMKDALSFSQFIPVEAAKFDEMTGAGLNAQTAQDTVKAISNLTPEEGYSQVRDVQNWDAICAMTIADTEKIAAMRAYMTDKQEEKLDEVIDMGFDVDDYPEIYRIIDAYTSGTGKKARTIKYLQKEYGIEYAAAKKLYEVFK